MKAVKDIHKEYVEMYFLLTKLYTLCHEQGKVEDALALINDWGKENVCG